MRRLFLVLLLCACSKPSTKSTPPTTAGESPVEDLDVPTPEPAPPLTAKTDGDGGLVPWMPPKTPWRGRGPPPSNYSLYELPTNTPLLTYAGFTRDACEAELTKRKITFHRSPDLESVRAPVLLDGPLHGVTFHSKATHLELDCRLVLALDDFSITLAAHDIVGANVYSSYRSPKENGCTNKYAGEQHCAALAADIGIFEKKDKSILHVEKDFHGKIGNLTCKPNVGPKPETPKSKELWELVCGAAGRQFQVILTPNWNEQHKNHFHLELTTHEWVLIR